MTLRWLTLALLFLTANSLGVEPVEVPNMSAKWCLQTRLSDDPNWVGEMRNICSQRLVVSYYCPDAEVVPDRPWPGVYYREGMKIESLPPNSQWQTVHLLKNDKGCVSAGREWESMACYAKQGFKFKPSPQITRIERILSDSYKCFDHI